VRGAGVQVGITAGRGRVVSGMKRNVSVVALLSFLLISPVFAGQKDEPAPNFGVVLENAIYRGGQPDEEDLERLKSMGVRTILKLNTRDASEERQAVKRLGMTFIYVPTKPTTISAPDRCRKVNEALEAMLDRDNWPIYVHCAHGEDRTGFVIGVYRKLIDHWSWKEIDRELEKYGHDENNREDFPGISRTLKSDLPSCLVKPVGS
jgi:protein tyrosine/serine phosphatase